MNRPPPSATISRRGALGLFGAAATLPLAGLAQRPATAGTMFHWRLRDRRFGGFSAIHVYPDGARFLAVSDRAQFFEGQLIRAADGEISDVAVTGIHPLLDTDGTPLRGPRGDSEGLAVASDGTLYVSFEGGSRTRVFAYADTQSPGMPLPRHPDFRTMASNGALEALAVDTRDRLYTLPEMPVDGRFPVYRFATRGWSPDIDRGWDVIGHIPQEGDFLAVGADFGPDGRFYLLERRFQLLRFSTRVRRFEPGRWSDPETLIETAPGTLDNHEGISLSRSPEGRLRITLISDDNRFFMQRTEIVEFLLG